MSGARYPTSQVRKFARTEERVEMNTLEARERELRLELAGILARQATLRRRIRNRMVKVKP